MRRGKGVRKEWGQCQHHCESASGKGNTKTLLRPPKDKAASLKSCQGDEKRKPEEEGQARGRKNEGGEEEKT